MKATPGSGKVSGFKWGGEAIAHWIRIGNERYPLTQAQWERRAARVAEVASADKTAYNTDTKESH